MHWLVNFVLGYIAGAIGATAFIFWVGNRIIETKEDEKKKAP